MSMNRFRSNDRDRWLKHSLSRRWLAGLVPFAAGALAVGVSGQASGVAARSSAVASRSPSVTLAGPAPASVPSWRLGYVGEGMCNALPDSVAKLACYQTQRTLMAGPRSGVWQLTQQIRATLQAGRSAPLTVRQAYAKEVLATLRPYFYGHPFSHGATPSGSPGLRFYDDNAWVGMVLAMAYRESGLRALLYAAEGVMQFEFTGQWRPSDPTRNHSDPGGIYWTTHRHKRPLTANAGATYLALQLYRVTRNRAYLAFAKRDYRWLRETLRNPNGLYRQFEGLDGNIRGFGGVNGQAMVAGDAAMLSHITHSTAYLGQSRLVAERTWRRFGPILQHIKPVYTSQAFYLLPRSSLLANHATLNAYANWLVKHMSRGKLLLAFGNRTLTPTSQAGATGVLAMRLQIDPARHG